MAFTPENFRESYTGVTILEVCTWQSTAKLIGDRSWLQDLASGQLHDSRLLCDVPCAALWLDNDLWRARSAVVILRLKDDLGFPADKCF
jgi:hypothetical protein